MKKLLLTMLALTALATSAFAADVNVSGRSYVLSCGYFSAVAGDYEITYENSNIPSNATVTAHIGWGGERMDYKSGSLEKINFEWTERQSSGMQSVAPHTWNVNVSKTLHSRSEPLERTSLQFVIEVRLPDGSVFFERGSSTQMGFYNAMIKEPGRPCVSSPESYPPMQTILVTGMDRN